MTPDALPASIPPLPKAPAPATAQVYQRRSRLSGWWPFGPIFNKELREMARRKRSYVLRFFYLALLLTVLGFTWMILVAETRYYANSIAMQAQRQATMGKVFFAVFSLFSIVAMHLVGPVLTSTAIGSERLKRTFDVLLMTPISAWQLVGGKLFSRLLTAVTLIGLSLPVLAIVRLLGGVELEDMFGAVVLAITVAMSSAAIGLLLSCWIKRAWAVILLAYIIQGLIYGLFPMLIAFAAFQLLARSIPKDPWFVMTAISASNPMMAAVLNIEAPRGAPFLVSWWLTAAVQVGLTLILTLLAAVVVRRIGKREMSGSGGSGAVTTIPLATQIIEPRGPGAPPPLPYSSPSTEARPRRQRAVGDNPILWRELRRPLLPRRWMRWTASLTTLGLLVLTYAVFSLDNSSLLDEEEMHIVYTIIMHGLLMLMAVVVSATAIGTEKESDTWTMLIAAPLSGQQVMWAKFAGVVRRLFWPWTVLLLHVGIFTLAGVIAMESAIIVLMVSISFNLVWIASGLYLSLRLKRVTTAVVLNLLIPVAIHGLAPLGLAAIEYGLDWWEFRELPEITLYWLPYWYIGEGIDSLSGNTIYGFSYYGHNDFQLPFSDQRWSARYFLPLAALASMIQIIIAALIVWWSGFRFDRFVKRAR